MGQWYRAIGKGWMLSRMGIAGALSLSIGCWAFGEMVRHRPREARVDELSELQGKSAAASKENRDEESPAANKCSSWFMDLRKADPTKLVLTEVPIGQAENAVPQ